jgi:hypothetical protein
VVGTDTGDIESFRALVAQTGSNSFTAADVDALFKLMVGSRTPNGVPGSTEMAGGDVPFKSLAAPLAANGDTLYPRGSGINDTFLRASGGKRLFETSPAGASVANGLDNPILKYELMNKIFNNVTTRSNVFGVWVTVGFFEVFDTDPTTGLVLNPPKLGREIGKATGQNIRHRMFALIDRSAMAIPANLTATTAPIAGAGSQPVTVGTTSGSSTLPAPIGTSTSWTIQPGNMLVVDAGNPGQEVVTVTAVAANSITANFTKAHLPGVSISAFGVPGPTIGGVPTIYGNPGPQPVYSPRTNSAVVPYFNIIQ